MSSIQDNKFQSIISHAKEYGFVFPSSEIYDGLGAVYDYGPWGSELKKNIRDYWWKSMTQMHENIVGIDAAIFMHPTTWKASGHVDNFSDPMIDNKDSKKRYRVDHLIENYVENVRTEAKKLENQIINDNKWPSLDFRKLLPENISPEAHLYKEHVLNNLGSSISGEGVLSHPSKTLEGKAEFIEKVSEFLISTEDYTSLKYLIEAAKITCPISGTANWTDIRQFNLMFSTQMSAIVENEKEPTEKNEAILFNLFKKGKEIITQTELKELGFDLDLLGEHKTGVKLGDYVLGITMIHSDSYRLKKEDKELYLRPETAQGIFVNFLNVQKTARMKIPFGIAQTGKAFRNEIVARQFIFRMREFEQMEMQFFCRPGTEDKWYEYWKNERMNWHLSLGVDPSKYRYHDHAKLAHYAKAAVDIEFEFPIGFKEVEGIHSRTDFDLKQHQEYSKKKQQYFDAELDENGKPYGNYIPYVVETSIGLDRMFLLVLSNAYEEEVITKEDGKTDSRTVLRFPAKIAPMKLAVLPLMKKDGLPELARKLMDDCKPHFRCFYEEKDTIGKRYRRMDAIGTPFCVTIDHQTKEDDTVTIRYRDNMQQERVPMSKVKEIVMNAIQ